MRRRNRRGKEKVLQGKERNAKGRKGTGKRWKGKEVKRNGWVGKTWGEKGKKGIAWENRRGLWKGRREEGSETNKDGEIIDRGDRRKGKAGRVQSKR